MNTTTNYGLNLPEGSDYADIAKLNENAVAIDTQLKANADAAVAKEAALKNQAAKVTPVDADSVPVIDSADASKTKLVLWSSIKELFAAATHTHAWSAITGKPSSYTPSAHAATHKTGGTDAMTPADIAAATKPVIVTGTLTTAGWVLNSTNHCYEQTVACAGLLATDGKNIRVEQVGSTDSDAQALTDAAYAMVDRFVCNDGSLYARCPSGLPSVTFQVAVVISR